MTLPKFGVIITNMKIKHPAPKSRPYRQAARADAAAATRQRIVGAFLGFLRERWLDEITLSEVAEAAGVTVQTIIRRFSGKEGLLKASIDVLDHEIGQRRAAPLGNLRQTVEALARDYEEVGDMVVRCLAQEERNPALKVLLDHGRHAHPQWLAESFAPWLDPLPPEQRERRVGQLIAVSDVYLWKLLRRDHGKSAEEYIDLIADLIGRLLADPDGGTHPPHRGTQP